MKALNQARNFSGSKIIDVLAREVIDSRGNPTVEAEVVTSRGAYRAAVPSGASTGHYEALELRDKDPSRYLGKGVLSAIKNVKEVIKPGLVGRLATDQLVIDQFVVETLDGSKNEFGWSKSKLGANAILAVSLALARAGAADSGKPLYEYISRICGSNQTKFVLPVPSMNVINGGSHAGNKLAMQEFMILPTGASSFREGLRMGIEVYHTLKKVIQKKYGLDATNVGDEGGFAPAIQDNREGLTLLMEAIEQSGHLGKVQLGMDVAASEFWLPEEKLYDLDFKSGPDAPHRKITGQELAKMYAEFVAEYPIVSIEDPFDQDDWEAYAEMTKALGDRVQIVGDDLLVTNTSRIRMAAEKKACNALLLKVNQIGSLKESLEAANMSVANKWGVMVSHRSGETEDSFIADLVVGLGSGQIKTGAPCRSERTAKYNQLLRIEEELGERAVYAGNNFRNPQILKL